MTLRGTTTLVAWWHEGHRIIPDKWVRKGDDFGDLNWLGHALNAYHHHTRWLKPYWWREYVWPAPPRYHRNGKTTYEWGNLNRWEVRRCRMKGHPNGIVYYSSGCEPDTRCKDCGENIG